MRNIKLPTKNPYLIFAPFLALYVIVVFLLHKDAMTGDESRYYRYAENLLQGFLSPPPPDIDLWNGPGYSIVLMPIVALGLPLIAITLLNAAFQYLSIVLLFQAMRHIVPFRQALLFSLFWALCYSAYSYMGLIYTESLTIFLLALLLLCTLRAFRDEGGRYAYFSGFLIGYIALVKIIFGYVILVLLLGAALLWLLNRKSSNHRTASLIMLVALVTTLPYLAYTYNLTGKVFYWGNSGGMSLYWMSTPHENEYGDWKNEVLFTEEYSEYACEGATQRIRALHQEDIGQVLKYTGVEKDEMYKQLAINNIKNHPDKYARNILANISRLLFGFPYSYRYQSPLLKLLYYSVVFSLMLFSLVPTVLNWKKLPYGLRFLLIFILVYLGGSALVSAYNRQFVVIIPLLLLWISYIFQRSVSVKWNFEDTA